MAEIHPAELVAFARRNLGYYVRRRTIHWEHVLCFDDLPTEIIQLIIQFAGDPPFTMTARPLELIRPVYIRSYEKQTELLMRHFYNLIGVEYTE